MAHFMLTFIVGAIFGYVFYKLKVPGGMMIGAIFGSSLLSITTSTAYMPEYGKYAAQITAGAFIGTTMAKDDLKEIRSILFPLLTLILGLMILNIAVGFLIWYVSPLSLITALMGCVPGGLSDVPMIAADMGADVHKVAIMQFSRLIVGVGLFPSLIFMISCRGKTKNTRPKNQPMNKADKNTKTERVFSIEMLIKGMSDKKNKAFAITIILAACGGGLGKLIGLPGGMLLFSMLSIIIFKITTNEAYMPSWAKRTAQVLAGTYIGSSMVLQDVLDLNQMAIPIILLGIGYFLNCCVVGYILHKKFGFSVAEAMLAATPAGASDMALISGDLGVKSPRLVVMQVMRLLIVIAIFPQVMHFIDMLF